MFRSLNEIRNYVLMALDGEIGRCKDFLFDDDSWGVRYMVADTGKWLPKRKVLISPASIGIPDWANRRIPLTLRKEDIESSPPLELDAPVSRRHERMLAEHYGWRPFYWSGGNVGTTLPPLPNVTQPEDAFRRDKNPGKRHLRSVKEVSGYHIRASNGEIGHADDFIVDDSTWTIRYLVVDTRNWLPGRKVVVSPGWIVLVDWAEKMIETDLSTEAIRKSPEFDPSQPVNRRYEERLYDFYGRPAYW